MRINKYLIFVFLINLILESFAQNCSSETLEYIDVVDWKWWPPREYLGEDFDECKMWSVWNTSINDLRFYKSPFTAVTASDKIFKIAQSGDFYPERGWVLIYRNFGENNEVTNTKGPYFILYNSERSLLRVFYFVTNDMADNANSYTMTLYSTGRKNTGVISFDSFSNAPSLEAIRSGEFDNEVNSDSKLSISYVSEKGDIGKDTWIYGDFEVGFDPDLGKTSHGLSSRNYEDATLSIRIEGTEITDLEGSIDGASCQSSSISLCEDFSFSSVQKTDNTEKIISNLAKNVQKGSKGASGFLTWLQEKNKYTTVKFEKQFLGKFGTRFLENQLNYKIIKEAGNDYSKLVKFLDGTSKFAGAVPGVLSTINSVYGLFKDVNETTPEIRYSTYKFRISGKLTTTNFFTNLNFKVPGADYSRDFNKGLLPYYDCPIGTGILSNTPVFSTVYYDRTICRKKKSPWIGKDKITYHKREYKSLKLSNDLKFYFSSNANGTPVTIEASVIAKMPASHLSDDNKTRYRVFTPGGRSEYYYYFNLLQHEILMNSLNLIDYLNSDENNGEGDEMILATPALDIKNLKGIAINVPADSEISLAIVATFSNGYIFKKTYRVVEDEISIDLSDHPMYDEKSIYSMPPFANYSEIPTPGSLSERIFLSEDYLAFAGEPVSKEITSFSRLDASSRNEILPSANFKLYAGRSIVLKPGFHAHNGSKFHARTFSADRSNLSGAGSDIEVSVLGDCYNSDASSMGRYIEKADYLSKQNEDNILLFPNPNEGIFNIDWGTRKSYKVDMSLFNLGGKEIWQYKGSTDETRFNSGIDKSGIYILQIRFEDGTVIDRKLKIQ